jgi:hypothetical protein
MTATHRARVEATLAEAATNHAALLERLPPEVRATLPVDAQGLTGAIDLVAEAAGLSSAQRRALVQPHAVNPAVMHARVFGGAPLTEETLMGSFVEGARVRADALADLAEVVGGAALGSEVRALLVECPLPLAADGLAGVPALRDAYAAQERAVVAIAARLDEVTGG